MYKIVAADGKEYGPFDLNEMRKWIAEGRLNAQTRVQGPGGIEWRPAAEFPELGFGPGGVPAPFASNPPPLSANLSPTEPEKGLAITSFVLGLMSLVCFGPLMGIPAIICGHIARSKARHQPGRYGGAGLALAGLILGYVGAFATLIVFAAIFLPAFSTARHKAQEIRCMNNMKQIGLAARTWALDHDGEFPFNVSTNKGGTLELCLPGADGFDQNAIYHFRVMSNLLSTPRILVCPGDTGKHPALDFANLQPANLSYQMRSGAELAETNVSEVLVICPIHHTVLRCDGSVERPQRKTRRLGE